MHEVQLDLALLLAQTKAKLTAAVPEQVWPTCSKKNPRSVVYNLLSNAPTRTGCPKLSVSCQPQGDYQVLAVQDNGLGPDFVQGTERLFTSGPPKKQKSTCSGPRQSLVHEIYGCPSLGSWYGVRRRAAQSVPPARR